MELRSYPITEGQLYACNIKLHATEILALHYDAKNALATEIIDRLKEATLTEASRMKKLKEENVERNS